MNIQYLKSILLFSFFYSLPFGEGWGGASFAQSNITFDAGQVFSTYNFIDSQGNKQNTDLTPNIAGCFSLGYQQVKNNGLFIRANLGMRKAGASMTVDGINISWNTQYADANAGLGYMLNKWRLKPYLSVSPYFGYLLKANQTIGQDTYDIKKNKSMEDTDFGLFFSPGFKIALSNYISFYTEYKNILGMRNLEKTEQKSHNRGFSINLGVAVTIIKYRYATTQ